MGSYITIRRQELGLSQAELSRRIGIKQPSLHAIESGKTKSLKGSTLAALADALRVTPDVILNGLQNVEGDVEAIQMQSELVVALRKLGHQRRLMLLEYARFLLNTQPPGEAPSTPALKAHRKV